MEEQLIDKTDKPSRKIKLMAIEHMVEHYDQLIYHTINFGKRISGNIEQISRFEPLSNQERCMLEASLWLYASMFSRVKPGRATREAIVAQQEAFVDAYALDDLLKSGFSEQEAACISDALRDVVSRNPQSGKIAIILKDALIMDFLGKNGKERLEQFYQEAILNDAKISIKKFYALMIEFLSEYESATEYSALHIKPKITELILVLEKEQRKLEKRKDIVLKKELDIDEAELKRLRKNLSSMRGRDARGIQTLFRTTSHNHYTLNEMVDRKANIMITVNSIILSVVIGGFVRFADTEMHGLFIAAQVLSVASFLSIVFAIISITPNRTQGRFTLDEIRNKNGNLLYFGNFHNMGFKDYEWGMLQKLNDSDFLYSSMIKDLYFLGKALQRKYKFIRISLSIFLVGLVASFLISTLYRFFV